MYTLPYYVFFCFYAAQLWVFKLYYIHENSGLSFRIIELSAQMTGSYNKSLCGILVKHQVPKQDVERS